MDLLDKLEQYCAEGYVPMHMPGHKRNTDILNMGNPYGLDITEIDGFDNLNNPTGILKQSMDRAAELYGAKRTWYLVNGSSIGLMSAISALTNRCGRILLARNCHISVYNAVYENELYPVYIYPEIVDNLWISGAISPDIVEKKLSVNMVDNSNKAGYGGGIEAVVITSPTYEGNISDIRKIADIVHQHNIPLIVDEAHGAHFGYSDRFPVSALNLGADVVVQSLHKTLPSLTQTALIHVSRDSLKPEEYSGKIDRYVKMFQTTSPSYLLMASIDRCISLMNSDKGRELTKDYVRRVESLRRSIGGLSFIRLAPSDDISKLVLYAENVNLHGKQLYDILLKQYGIQLEMASYRYVIAMTSILDKQEYYDRFLAALQDIDTKIARHDALCADSPDIYSESEDTIRGFGIRQSSDNNMEQFCGDIRLTPYEAVNSENELVGIKDSPGRISASTVCVYPPGVPLVCPGEVIKTGTAKLIIESIAQGLEVIGLEKQSSMIDGAAAKPQEDGREGKILCLK